MNRSGLILLCSAAAMAFVATSAPCDPPPAPVLVHVVPTPTNPTIIVIPVPTGPAMPTIIDVPIDPAIIDKCRRGTIKMPVTWPPKMQISVPAPPEGGPARRFGLMQIAPRPSGFPFVSPDTDLRGLRSPQPDGLRIDLNIGRPAPE